MAEPQRPVILLVEDEPQIRRFLRAAFEIEGYRSVAPLTRSEVDSLYLIVRARLAMRAVIGSWRLNQCDGRGDAAQIDDALDLLELLHEVGAAEATERWRTQAGV